MSLLQHQVLFLSDVCSKDSGRNEELYVGIATEENTKPARGLGVDLSSPRSQEAVWRRGSAPLGFPAGRGSPSPPAARPRSRQGGQVQKHTKKPTCSWLPTSWTICRPATGWKLANTWPPFLARSVNSQAQLCLTWNSHKAWSGTHIHARKCI